MTTPTINIVGPEYLEPIMHLPVATIKVYARQFPERLPPRWKPPGGKKLLWLESDAIDWINACRTVKPAPIQHIPARSLE
jgi:hypothetical protein